MNVREYIEALQKCPPEARVVKPGPEGGADDVNGPVLGHLVQYAHNAYDYAGPHEFYERAEDAIDKAIFLGMGESALCQAVELR